MSLAWIAPLMAARLLDGVRWSHNLCFVLELRLGDHRCVAADGRIGREADSVDSGVRFLERCLLDIVAEFTETGLKVIRRPARGIASTGSGRILKGELVRR